MTKFINNEQKKVCETICNELDKIQAKLEELKIMGQNIGLDFEFKIIDTEDDLFFQDRNNKWQSSNMYDC